MADRSWKRTERTVARRLGGRRTGVVAQWGHPGTPDVYTDWLAVEVKERRALPAWLHLALSQARAGATSEQLPLVVLHESGRRHDEDMILLRLADFEDWFGRGSSGTDDGKTV